LEKPSQGFSSWKEDQNDDRLGEEANSTG